MELNKFIEKFLPDYKELFGAYKNEYGWKYNSATYLLLAFSRKYFPEALQNFADRICEKQRENSLVFFNEAQDFIGIDDSALDGIQQPEIDEL
jgi:hypothetical protein